MPAHHLKPDLDSVLLFQNSVVSPARTAWNLGVTLDDQLSFTANIAATTCSCRFILHNIRRICLFPHPGGRFCSRLFSSRTETTATLSWLVCLHVPSDLCSSFRIQKPGWSLTHLSFPTLCRSSAPCTGYQWLLESNSRHWHLPADGSGPSNHTPQPVHYATPRRLATPSLRGVPATAQQNHTHWHQVCINSTHLPSQTENSSVQTAPWPMKIKKSKQNKTKQNKNPLSVSYLFVNLALGAFWSSSACLMYLLDSFWGCIHMVECTYCKSLWINASAKQMKCNVLFCC